MFIKIYLNVIMLPEVYVMDWLRACYTVSKHVDCGQFVAIDN